MEKLKDSSRSLPRAFRKISLPKQVRDRNNRWRVRNDRGSKKTF